MNIEELVRIELQNGISAVDNALVVIPEELHTNVLAICFADKLVQDYRINAAQIDKSQAFNFAEREINEAVSMIRSALMKEHGGCDHATSSEWRRNYV